MKPIIDIQGLGKRYRLNNSSSYLSLRDVIDQGIKGLIKKQNKKDFWALEDLDMQVLPGERIGIIGKNGAGKSTLLKIISRITPPTRGMITMNGRVASLLEVGTGFHPELTGRENIYFNGSILGLKKKQIKAKLDEIIDFSGTGSFIDMPMKHYSSGMQLRLAFSVAAHLEPDIFLIDEVLAVGDLEFQKKCLGKMEEVSTKEGRTILFVSHSMDAIRKFCSRSVLLNEGRIVTQGTTEDVITEYVASHLETKPEETWGDGIVAGDGSVALQNAFLHDRNGNKKARFDTTEDIGVTMKYQVLKDGTVFTHGLNLYNQETVNLFNSHDVVSPVREEKRLRGNYIATAWIPGHLLSEGLFTVGLALFLPNPLNILVHQKEALRFEIYSDLNKISARGNYAGNDFGGLVRPFLNWETTHNSQQE